MSSSLIEKIEVKGPRAAKQTSLLSSVPTPLILLFLATLAYLTYSKFFAPTKKAPRRGTRPATTRVPRHRPSLPSASNPSRPSPLALSTASRRSSGIGLGSSAASQSGSMRQRGNGLARESPLRPSFPSTRRVTDLSQPGGGRRSSMGSVGGFAREGSYGGAEGSGSETAYEPVQQQDYSAHVSPTALGRPQAFPANPLPRVSSSTYGASHPSGGGFSRPPPPSAAQPRRRFTMSGAPTASAAARGSKRRYYREAEERGSKRSRWAERDGSDEMDVEDEAWGRGAGEGRRGVKRSAREGGGEAKRTRREVEEEEQEQEIDGMDLGEEESERTGEEEDEGRRTESPRKRRARSTESDRSVKVRSASKRPRSGVRTKPSSKRAIDDVDQSSEEFEDADDTDGVRNADSDLGSGDEEDGSLGLKETSPSATLSSSDRPSADRKRGGKRSRSVGRRRNSDDEDVMGGTMDDVMPASRSAPNKSLAQPAGWKRTALSNNRASTANGRASQAGKAPVPTAGVTWTDYEGVLFKIDEAGNRRRLCEVKEIRKKFKMPKDSKHPDRDVTHEVIVERWLSDAEYDEAMLARRLAWQRPIEPEVVPEKVEAPLPKEAPKETKADAIYPAEAYAQGRGTPLRSYDHLLRPSSSRRTSLGTPSRAPALPNGRLRMVSGTPSTSAKAGWSHGKAITLFQDEQKAKEERERRRLASIALGGEADPVPVQEVAPTPPVASASAGPSSFFTAPKATLPKPETSAPAPAAPLPNFFGGAKTAAPAASTSSVPATGVLGFTPTVTAAPVVSNASSSTPSFSFQKAQPPAEPKATSSSFSFGPPPSTANPTPAPTPASAPAPIPAPVKTVPSFFSIPPAAPPASTSSTTSSASAQPPAQPAGFSFGPAPTLAAASSTSSSAEKAPAPATSQPSFFRNLGKPAASVPTPATAAPSPFSFGAPPPLAATATPASTNPSPFGFGAPAAAPSAPTPAANSSPFGFGAPSAPAASTAPSNPSPFGFGARPAPAAASNPSPFGFGASTGPTPPTTAANPSPFGFGASAAPPATATTAAPFSFGAPASAPATNLFGGGAPSTNLFGNTSSAPTTSTASSASSTLFGTAPTSAPSASLAARFGINAPPSTSTPTAGASPFGAPAPSPFGSASSAPSPFGAPTPFGTSNPSAFGAAPPAAAAAPPAGGMFSFGAPAPAQAPPATGGATPGQPFKFGTTPILFAGETPAAPTAGGFSFGALPTPSGDGTGATPRRRKELPKRR